MKAMSEAYEATARFYQEKFGLSLNEFSLFQIYDDKKQKLTAFLRANLPSLGIAGKNPSDDESSDSYFVVKCLAGSPDNQEPFGRCSILTISIVDEQDYQAFVDSLGEPKSHDVKVSNTQQHKTLNRAARRKLNTKSIRRGGSRV